MELSKRQMTILGIVVFAISFYFLFLKEEDEESGLLKAGGNSAPDCCANSCIKDGKCIDVCCEKLRQRYL